MNNNSLDELKISKPEGKQKNPNGQKKKKQLRANPLFKELKPIMYFATGILVLGVSAKLTLFDDMGNYHYTNLTVGMEQAKQSYDNTKTSIVTSARLDTERIQMEEMIEEKRAELDEANLVRTPLEQSFYFTAYFDSLIKKHSIKLNDMQVQASRTADGVSMSEEELGIVSASAVGVSPITVEFEGSYNDVANLFNDLYTKRIIYDEDLTIVNKLDGQVSVKMIVKFTQQVPVVEGEEFATEEGDDSGW